MVRLASLTFLCTLLLFANSSAADVVRPDRAEDVTVLEAEHEAWYYGVLEGDPHTYMLYLSEPLSAQFEVLVPRSSDTRKHAAIIVKQATRGVDEVARLEAETAPWSTHFDFATGDLYRRGSRFEGELSPAIYTIQVYTPDNQGPYVLRFGEGGSLSGGWYFKKLGHLYAIKKMQGKSAVSMVCSPYVYVPLVLLSLLFWWFYKRKRHV